VRWAFALACAGPALGTLIALFRRRTLEQVTAAAARRATA
jgi:hypothetical protein